MTTKRIAFSLPSGAVKYVCPSPEFIAELMNAGASEDEAVAVVQALDVPSNATNIEVIERTSLPDREFRLAWEKTGLGITIPIAKAKTLAQRIIAALVREEVTFLQDRRTQAGIENDTTLIGQIDTRLTTIQATIVTQIRDGIAAATTLANLKTAKQTYLDGRPQVVRDAL